MKNRKYLLIALLGFIPLHVFGMGSQPVGLTAAEFTRQRNAVIDAIRESFNGMGRHVAAIKNCTFWSSIGSATLATISSFFVTRRMLNLNLTNPTNLAIAGSISALSGCLTFLMMKSSRCLGLLRYCTNHYRERNRFKAEYVDRLWHLRGLERTARRQYQKELKRLRRQVATDTQALRPANQVEQPNQEQR